MRYYAILYSEDCTKESDGDRLYRFDSGKERTSFIARTYSDPARPKSLPIKIADAKCRFRIKEDAWKSDDFGEYVTTRKAMA